MGKSICHNTNPTSDDIPNTPKGVHSGEKILSIRFISLNLSPFTIFFKIFLYTYIDIIVKTTHAKNLRIWWSRCQDTRSSSTRTFDGGTTKSGTRYKHLPQVPMTDGRLMNSMYSFPL